MPARYGAAAHSRTYSFQRGFVDVKQLPQHGLAPHGAAHLAQLDQREVRVRRGRHFSQQRLSDRRQQPSAAGVRQEADFFRAQRLQQLIRAIGIGKPIFAEQRFHRFRRGIRAAG